MKNSLARLMMRFFRLFVFSSVQSEAKNDRDCSSTHPTDGKEITTVRRNYQMAYTPSGFWSRLITRLIVSVQRWRTIEQIKEESYSLVYWREGIGVVYEGGYFQVESYQELVGCVMILCFSCCVTLFGGYKLLGQRFLGSTLEVSPILEPNDCKLKDTKLKQFYQKSKLVLYLMMIKQR